METNNKSEKIPVLTAAAPGENANYVLWTIGGSKFFYGYPHEFDYQKIEQEYDSVKAFKNFLYEVPSAKERKAIMMDEFKQWDTHMPDLKFAAWLLHQYEVADIECRRDQWKLEQAAKGEQLSWTEVVKERDEKISNLESQMKEKDEKIAKIEKDFVEKMKELERKNKELESQMPDLVYDPATRGVFLERGYLSADNDRVHEQKREVKSEEGNETIDSPRLKIRIALLNLLFGKLGYDSEWFTKNRKRLPLARVYAAILGHNHPRGFELDVGKVTYIERPKKLDAEIEEINKLLQVINPDWKIKI